jgi:ATP-dependent DNA helicase 2 subunit 1
MDFGDLFNDGGFGEMDETGGYQTAPGDFMMFGMNI